MSAVLTRSLKTKARSLTWPARPRRSVHPALGRRLDWTSRCRCYRVTCYPEQTGRFIAQWLACVTDETTHGQVLSHHSTLAAAQRACLHHARQTGGSQA